MKFHFFEKFDKFLCIKNSQMCMIKIKIYWRIKVYGCEILAQFSNLNALIQ